MYQIDNMDFRGRIFMIFSIVTSIVAILAVLGRLHVRLNISKSVGTDDWLLLLSVVLFTGASVTGVMMSMYGFGAHEGDIEPSDAKMTLKYMYAQGICTYTCIIALRISLCLFFLRLTIVVWYRRILYLVAIVTTLINSLNLFRVNIFYCYPVSDYWDVDPDFDGGTCLTAYAENTLLYTQFAISVTADLVTSLLPLLMFKNSTLNIRTKIITCFLLGLGIIGSLGAVAAIALTSSYNDGTDYYYTSVFLFLAQIAEPFLGIIASSFATYRPLFRSLKGALQERNRKTEKLNREPRLNHVVLEDECETTGQFSFQSESKTKESQMIYISSIRDTQSDGDS